VKFNSLLQAEDKQVLFLPLDKTLCISSCIATVSNQLFVLPSEGVLAPTRAEQN